MFSGKGIIIKKVSVGIKTSLTEIRFSISVHLLEWNSITIDKEIARHLTTQLNTVTTCNSIPALAHFRGVAQWASRGENKIDNGNR